MKKGRPISELPIPDGGASSRARPRFASIRTPTAGVPGRSAGELVPGAGHRAGQRGSDRRQERARRPPRRAPAAAAMAAAHHGLRRALAGRSGRLDWSESIKQMQRNWIGKSEGAEVNFSIVQSPARCHGWACSECFHHAPGHAVRRDLHGAGPGASRWSMRSPRRNNSMPLQRIRKRHRARATSNAPNWPRRRPASSPARMPSIR